MPHFNALPTELLHHILGFLIPPRARYGDQIVTSERQPERETLRNASLVARAWRTPAQATLVSRVIIRTDKDARRLLTSPLLERHAVLDLTITRRQLEDGGHDPTRHVTIAELLDVVHGVRIVTMVRVQDMDPTWFAGPRFASVYRLELWEANFYPCGDLSTHLLPLWKLRELELTATAKPFSIPRGFLRSSAHSLFRLCWLPMQHYIYDPNLIASLDLATIGPNLRGLDLLDVDERWLADLKPYLPHLTSLSRIAFSSTIRGMARLTSLLDGLAAAKGTIYSLRLTLGNVSHRDRAALEQLVRSHGALSGMKRLTLLVSVGSETPSEWEPLRREISAKRGGVFKVHVTR